MPGARVSRRTALLILADTLATTVLAWCTRDESATPARSADIGASASIERDARSPAAETRADISVPARTHGPLLGAMTDTSVRIWARGDRAGKFAFQVRGGDDSWPGRTFGPADFDADRDYTGVVDVTGLNPATRYEYRLIVGGQDTGSGSSFTTLPATNSPAAFRFTIGGDLYFPYAPFTILSQVARQAPDFNILLGDLVYADSPTSIPPTREAYRTKYRQNWDDWSFRQLTQTVPSFMMWDDHEIINDYDGGDAVRYVAARAALEDYATSHNPASLRSDVLYYTFSVADVEFFVLDTRSYRSVNELPDNPAKTMLGSTQKSDLKQWLVSSQAPVKFILSSIPVHDLGIKRNDAWTAFASERAEILSFIRDRGIPGVVLISGDQHWASLVHHTSYDIWEFNATPLAQSVVTVHAANDPELALSYDRSPSFGTVDVDTRGPQPTVTFSIIDDMGRNQGSRQIALPRG